MIFLIVRAAVVPFTALFRPNYNIHFPKRQDRFFAGGKERGGGAGGNKSKICKKNFTYFAQA